MSTNESARPHSRRAALASLAAGMALVAAPIMSVDADPVLALVAAARHALEALDASTHAHSRAQEAHWSSEWHRRPRVLIGEYTAIARGPNFDPIPPQELVAIPVYVHDHAAIDRDCDSDARSPGADLAKVEGRRARLHRNLDADTTAIATAPDVIRARETERLTDEALAAYEVAVGALFTARPTTTAGLLAMVDFVKDHELELLDERPTLLLTGLCSAIRSIMREA